jgi:RIO kinase 1
MFPYEKIRERIKIERKIEAEIFDKNVLLTLGYLMNKKFIDTVDFPVSKGKEAYVFRATAGSRGKELGYDYFAIKIYMIETSPFRHMYNYIHGDPRFKGVKKKKKDLVLAWTKKEFRNLTICHEAGVHVPKPIFFKNNVLVMEYIGRDGDPAPLLKDVGPSDPKKNFRQLVSDIKIMYKNNIVHADISEFNILVKNGTLFIIDIGQGVSRSHPKAEEFLARDINNVARYFKKYGLSIDEDELLDEIRS